MTDEYSAHAVPSSSVLASSIVTSATNDSAAAGKIGEFISSSILQASPTSISNNTDTNVTSISLTAGDWDVWGSIGSAPAGGTTSTLLIGAISTTSATRPTAPAGGAYALSRLATAAGVDQLVAVGQTRISLAATTTVYLVGYSTFAISTMGAYGFLGARRVR